MEIDLFYQKLLTGVVDVYPELLLEVILLWLNSNSVWVEPADAAVPLLLGALPDDLLVFVPHVVVEPEDVVPAPHQTLVVVHLNCCVFKTLVN